MPPNSKPVGDACPIATIVTVPDCAGVPSGRSSVPSTFEFGTSCSWKSTPVRSSPTPTVTIPACRTLVVPG
jgi:hypothetical protein